MCPSGCIGWTEDTTGQDRPGKVSTDPLRWIWERVLMSSLSTSVPANPFHDREGLPVMRTRPKQVTESSNGEQRTNVAQKTRGRTWSRRQPVGNEGGDFNESDSVAAAL
jgi:hypothetical protein